jgi:hypothetical protein
LQGIDNQCQPLEADLVGRGNVFLPIIHHCFQYTR